MECPPPHRPIIKPDFVGFPLNPLAIPADELNGLHRFSDRGPLSGLHDCLSPKSADAAGTRWQQAVDGVDRLGRRANGNAFVVDCESTALADCTPEPISVARPYVERE